MKKKYKLIAVLVVLVLVVLGISAGCGKKDDVKEEQPNQLLTAENEQQEEAQEEEQEKPEQEESEEEKSEEPEKEILDESKAVVMKTTANVNLRQKPDAGAEVIKVISKGTELKKYSEENGWAKVKCGEEVGYVSMEYIVDPESIPEEKPEEKPAISNKVEAIPGQHRNPNSAVVVIDPGHQRNGDSKKEPNGPGSSEMKARVTSGTTGVSTGVPEYVLNLDVSLKLKTELENRGYTVYMTRSTHDINISNMERAQYATSVGADIAVRIHGNGAASSVRGAETLAPSANNPYVSHLSAASQSLSKCIIDKYCAATGFKNRGVKINDTMTGINWSEVPVTIIELGFMSNPEEDKLMQDANMQNNMVQGIANGIDAYFGF